MEPTNNDYVKQIVKKTFPKYRGRKFRVNVTDRINMASYWDGGSRDYFAIYNTRTDKVSVVPQQSAFDPKVPGIDSYEIKEDEVVVELCIFRGKMAYVCVHSNREII
jgi:hypothetical protein